MTALTPGGEALVEAARLELGRIYGQLQHEHHSADDEVAPASLHDLEAARLRRLAAVARENGASQIKTAPAPRQRCAPGPNHREGVANG